MKVERRRKRIYSFFFCRDASYLIQRCRKSSAEEKEFIHFSFAETHPILSKDSESRAECKELAQFAFPRRILSYSKIPKVERNAKSLLNLHSRDASYLIQRFRKSSGMQRTCSICIPETHPILFTPLSGFTSCNIAVQQSTNPQFPIIYANILPVDSYNQCNRHVPKHRNKAMAQRPAPSKAFLHFCLA